MAQISQGREQNPERILKLFSAAQELTRQEIAEKLSLSMPTTLQNVTEMVKAGILEECGAVGSNGGRRAKKFRLCASAGGAVGVNIALHEVELVCTDLLGRVQYGQTIPLAFCDTPDWYGKLHTALAAFLQKNESETKKIVGAGISFPGIIDTQADQIVHSHIFGLAHVGLERFRKSIPFPTVFANDANSASFAERESARGDYLYLSLNESVGGAIVINQQLLLGDTFQAGELGHMLLFPGGETCYCGKRGCVDAYLSPRVLTRNGQTLDSFFERLRAGDTESLTIWDTYLDHLAILLTNLRMLVNIDLVIGGQVGAYITPYLDALCAKAAQYDKFARDVDYISPCVQRERACAVGAAALALTAFGRDVLCGLSD